MDCGDCSALLWPFSVSGSLTGPLLPMLPSSMSHSFRSELMMAAKGRRLRAVGDMVSHGAASFEGEPFTMPLVSRAPSALTPSQIRASKLSRLCPEWRTPLSARIADARRDEMAALATKKCAPLLSLLTSFLKYSVSS